MRGRKKKNSLAMPIFLACGFTVVAVVTTLALNQSDDAVQIASEQVEITPAKLSDGAEPKITAVPFDQKRMKQWLSEYCTDCHGQKKQKGDVRLDQLLTADPDNALLDTLWDAIDQLEAGDMPPRKAKQPKSGHRKQMVAAMQSLLADLKHRASNRESTVLRRLTREEYRNTLSDLLKLNLGSAPIDEIPAEHAEHGFDTQAKSLRASKYHVQGYLEMANWAVNAATFPKEKPESLRAVVKGFNRAGFAKAAINDQMIDLYHGNQQARDLAGFKFIWRLFGKRFVPRSAGEQIHLKMKVQFVNRHIENQAIAKQMMKYGYDPKRNIRVGLHRVWGQGESAKRDTIATFPVNDEVTEIETAFFLPSNTRLAFSFINGPKFKDKTLGKILGMKGKVDLRKQAPQNLIIKSNIPKLRIHEIVLEARYHPTWPPESHLALYGDELTPEASIKRFAEKAFRRPVSREEIAPYLSLAAQGEEGLKHGLTGILSSPQFLYLDEPDGRLNSHAIASRLSYFIWSSLPDARLQQLAAESKLNDPVILREQVNRLLKDEKSEALRKRFLHQWLAFDNILAMPPMGNEFKVFRADQLHSAMLKESELFFKYMIDENRPVSELVDSDYTFVNGNLARLYGLKEDLRGDLGSEHQKVMLPADSKRGGLLGQGAVLTASANGVETSPVTRGIWLLEHLLGTPPAPPPPDIPAADPDIRGAKTIREILAKHRTDPTCNDCHRKIDPIGFTMENFDPIGRWREEYLPGKKVDAMGEMSGHVMHDVDDLRELLLTRKRTIARSLISKMLTYSTGRKMGTADRDEIETMTDSLAERGNGMRDLIELVVTSDIFLSK